ncbi:hypothetical protein SAMN04488564_104689 [Lentzea waywayandensis]|uniref:DUF4352 domain-containing protein n=2 Tax=Lentzea waywayandensis TaxID=84724 RepID=A0A1I6EKI2_9PSEU|nr:hypothetical protein SAMN04488564_104689 [Lentzea waywayandensis]
MMTATGEFWPTFPPAGHTPRRYAEPMRFIAVPALVLLLAACASQAAPQTTPSPEPTSESTMPPTPPRQEPFEITTEVNGVREWQNSPEEMGFVYRVQPIDFTLTARNTGSTPQTDARIRFVVEDMDGEGDLTVGGEGWTCEGGRDIGCTATGTTAPGGTWAPLTLTMRHTKAGQTSVVVHWEDVAPNVIFRYDGGT